MTFDEFVERENRRAVSFDELMVRIEWNIDEVERSMAQYQRISEFFKELLTGEQYVERCLKNPATYYPALQRMRFLDSSVCGLLEEIRQDRALIEIRVAEDHPGRSEGPPDPELERICSPQTERTG